MTARESAAADDGRRAPRYHAAMRMMALACVLLVGCGDNSPPPRPVAPSPSEGVDDPQLAALLVEQWELEADVDPLSASFYGERRGEDRLPPIAHADVVAIQARRHALLDKVTALPTAALSARDRISYGVLLDRLTVAAGLEVCDYERWQLGATSTLYRLDALGNYHLLFDAEDAASYLARVQAMPAAIDALSAELVAGAEAGETAPVGVVNGAFSALEVWGARPAEAWPIVAAIQDGYLDGDTRDALIADVSAVVDGPLSAAYLRLANTLRTRILPIARTSLGVGALPGVGHACYAAEIRRQTSVAATADELHAFGEAEVARVEAEMIALGQATYGVGTLPEIGARLGNDSAQYFQSEDDIIHWTKQLIAYATERSKPLFARFPTVPLELVPYSADVGQVAASYDTSPDGIQPAHYYFVTRPVGAQVRWSAESTTYHESVPGHHLQLGRAVELTDLPAIRRVFADNAYIEGWGLYAEGLADEVGMYHDDAARIGRLNNAALRAVRLVIDTGLHDLGWTRADATAYFEAHTLYRGSFVQNEITRYLTTPAQALAYKVGERELLRLRAAWQARDGAAFSLRDFHEAVLAEGSMPLPVLAERLATPPAAARSIAHRRRAERGTSPLLRRPPPPALASGFRAALPE